MKFRVSHSSFVLFNVLNVFMAASLCYVIYILFTAKLDAFMAIILIAVPLLAVWSSYSMRELAYARVLFDSSGITYSCFLKRGIYIPWHECSDIGIAESGNLIYFSKIIIDNERMQVINNIKLNNNFLKVQFSLLALNEILKYIPKEKIRNFDIIKNII